MRKSSQRWDDLGKVVKVQEERSGSEAIKVMEWQD